MKFPFCFETNFSVVLFGVVKKGDVRRTFKYVISLLWMNCKVCSTKRISFETISDNFEGIVAFALYAYRHVVGHHYKSICA